MTAEGFALLLGVCVHASVLCMFIILLYTELHVLINPTHSYSTGQCYYGSCHVLRSPQTSQPDFAV